MRSDHDRAQVHASFAHYMAPSVVDQVSRHPERLKLGGETRDVSLLFADVRGFSRLSEGLGPEELTQFLNRLFTPVSEIIVGERGTIDKFIGDAVMAFWGAPLDDPGHAQAACRAALRLTAAMERLNRQGAAEAARLGKRWETVEVGIGLNTGPCCAGNLGSPQRFDYSVIGEAVNVASRLEGVTKDLGVPILAGSRLADAARGFAFLDMGPVQLRGKDRPERVHALIGDEALAATERFRHLAAAHEALRTALAGNRRDEAEARLVLCRSLGWRGLDRLLDVYARRARALPAPISS
jgi:adenylate cyclase